MVSLAMKKKPVQLFSIWSQNQKIWMALAFLFLSATGAFGGQIFGPQNTATAPLPTMASTRFTTMTTNPGSYSIADSAAGVIISGPDQGADGINASCQTAPATPYTITAQVTVNPGGSRNNDSGGGLAWRDAGSGKLIVFYLLMYPSSSSSSGPAGISVDFADPSTYGGSSEGDIYVSGTTIWEQLSDNGTNAIERLSMDGANWLTISNVAKSSGYLGASGYNQVCFFASGHNGAVIVSLNSYKQTSP
jgi:hypothetical protein